MSTIELFLHNSSELMGFLCFAGLLAIVFRWRQAVRHDYLVAFAFFLAGSLMREVLVWQYGTKLWPEIAIHLTAWARVLQIVGSILFVRASLRDYCGEWGWALVFVICGVMTALV